MLGAVIGYLIGISDPSNAYFFAQYFFAGFGALLGAILGFVIVAVINHRKAK